MKIHSLSETSFLRRIKEIGEPGSERFANPIFLRPQSNNKDNGKQMEDYMYFVCSCFVTFGYQAHLHHSKKILRENRNKDGISTQELISIDGEPFDCEIIFNGFHFIDVKENFTDAECWNFWSFGSKKQLTSLHDEIINLSSCQGQKGAQAYFLVYFGKEGSKYQNKIIRFEVDLVRDYFFAGKNIIPAEKGKIWTIYDIMPRSEFQENYIRYGKNPYMYELTFGGQQLTF